MKIHYFGEIAALTKKSSEDLKIDIDSIFDLMNYLKSNYNIKVEDMHIAINHNMVSKSEDSKIKTNDEIAVLSAFAGG